MPYEGRTDVPEILKMYNPCAVFKGDRWKNHEFAWPGEDNIQFKTDRAIRFVSHAHGINAACVTLIGYQNKGINTIQSMIEKYAPRSENLTSVYIDRVSHRLRVRPNIPINVKKEKMMNALIRAIIMVECGSEIPSDLPPNWVEAVEIDRGVTWALGIVPRPTDPPKWPGYCSVIELSPGEERELFGLGGVPE